MMPVADLTDISENVDLLTVYINAERSNQLQDKIIDLHPTKIIFNPGAENSSLAGKCKANGIETENACTLVLLNSGQFEL